MSGDRAPRFDLEVVARLIAPRAKVLDVGCGDGALLEFLQTDKQVDGRGMELSQRGVNECVSRGLSVIQGDADRYLGFYPDKGFDYVVLSQTLQATRNPKTVLEHLLRIGDLNSQFHRRIHEFAGSSRLVSALASLIEAPLMMKTFESYQDEDLVRSAAHHLEIVRALEARDGDWSAALMRSHILGARGALRVL